MYYMYAVFFCPALPLLFLTLSLGLQLSNLLFISPLSPHYLSLLWSSCLASSSSSVIATFCQQELRCRIFPSTSCVEVYTVHCVLRHVLIGSLVSLSDGTSAVESVELQTRRGLLKGTCTLSPRRGNATDTVFSVSCDGYADEDSPLRYTLRVQMRKGVGE